MAKIASVNSLSSGSNLKPILIIGLLFFIFGFITWLYSVLIPYLKIACEWSTAQAYLVTSAFYIAYFVMAIPSSAILKITGFKTGVALGLIVMGVDAFFLFLLHISVLMLFFCSGFLCRVHALLFCKQPQTFISLYWALMMRSKTNRMILHVNGLPGPIACSVSFYGKYTTKKRIC